MNSHVLKIEIDPTTKTATGVQFKKNGVIYNIGARKEVILSAGSVNSPQILMLSGVSTILEQGRKLSYQLDQSTARRF